MFYAEWLRVRNCLRILAIVFAALFVIVALLRVALNGQIAGSRAWINVEMHERGARVTTTRLADGSTQTIYDVPSDHDRIVVVDRGWHGKTITVSGPGVENDRSQTFQVGTLGVHATRSTAQGGAIQVTTDAPESARDLLLLAAFVALIIATVLSGPLANENHNHLEVVWTKPISRERYALGVFGVDAIGILASMALAIVFMLLSTALFELPIIVIDPQTPAVLALTIFTPLAWYALLTAAAASLKRGRGAVLGLGWCAALFILPVTMGFLALQQPAVHFVGVVLSYLMLLDPILYIHMSGSSAPGDGTPVYGVMYSVLGAPAATRAAIVFALALIYSALSLVQWHRLEA